MHLLKVWTSKCVSVLASHSRIRSKDYSAAPLHNAGVRSRVSQVLKEKVAVSHKTALCSGLYMPEQSEAGTRGWKTMHNSASCSRVKKTAAECADLKYTMHKLWCWV
jgi:hypothetical protein